MSEETSYFNFLKNFISEDIYLIPEEDIQVQLEENADVTETNTINEPAIEPLKVVGREDSIIAIVLDENFSEELNTRFNLMIEKLGFSLKELTVINLTDQDTTIHSPDPILDFPSTKFIFFSSDKSRLLDKLPGDFETSVIDNKHILSLPSFRKITGDKTLILRCWNSLTEFTANQTND